MRNDCDENRCNQNSFVLFIKNITDVYMAKWPIESRLGVLTKSSTEPVEIVNQRYTAFFSSSKCIFLRGSGKDEAEDRMLCAIYVRLDA